MEVMGYAVEFGDISYEDLSKSGQELAALIGVPATLKLIENYGGRGVHIPLTAKEDNELVKLLGMSAVEKLCEYYGNDRLEISKEMRLRSKLRDLALIKRRKAGATGPELAKEFDLTLRHVWDILRKHKQKKGVEK